MDALALALLAGAAWAGFQPAVYGGEPAARSFWSRVVALDMDPGDYTGVQPCTGVLVSRRAVVTAAHCARPAAGGGLVAMSFFDRAGNVWLRVPLSPSSARVHPDYDAESSRADLAVVPVPVELPQGYRPVSLLADAGRLRPGVEVEVAGVGRTETGARGSLRRGRLAIKEVNARDKAFSAQDPAHATIACDGDSGGGAFLDDGATLAGLVFLAWEPVAAPCSGPGTTFFAAVPFYRDWIEKTAAELEKGG